MCEAGLPLGPRHPHEFVAKVLDSIKVILLEYGVLVLCTPYSVLPHHVSPPRPTTPSAWKDLEDHDHADHIPNMEKP